MLYDQVGYFKKCLYIGSSQTGWNSSFSTYTAQLERASQNFKGLSPKYMQEITTSTIFQMPITCQIWQQVLYILCFFNLHKNLRRYYSHFKVEETHIQRLSEVQSYYTARVFELEFRWVLLQILYSICKPIHEVYSTLLLYSLSRDVVELSHAFLGTQSLKIHCQRMAIPPSNKSYKRIRKDTFLFWGGSRIKSC